MNQRKRPVAGQFVLVVMPNTGHTLNLAEPAAFNACLDQFFQTVDAGRWPQRDPRAMAPSILG